MRADGYWSGVKQMTGYRIDSAQAPTAWAAVGKRSHQITRDTGSCQAIMAIAEDFQDIIRAECQRCRSATGACLVEEMRAAARGDHPG